MNKHKSNGYSPNVIINTCLGLNDEKVKKKLEGFSIRKPVIFNGIIVRNMNVISKFDKNDLGERFLSGG